ncbi:decapping and exoribonuclease protein-like [Epargyreus clarus]|uniref:decapping and exoribonuclease protein-like n=1 Tax=Epargyreus clarus TaxID=520877 RepID=UPI003C2EE301
MEQKRKNSHATLSSTRSKPNYSQKLRVNLSKPVIVGYMSVDGDRQYSSDLSQLKFLNAIPSEPVSLDLNHNIESAIKRTTDDNDEKITLLLRFLLDQHGYLKQHITKPTFISYRRTFISIMCQAYGTNEPIRIAATVSNGSIYLCSLETETDITRRQSRSKQEEKFCAWGYKFEQYLLSDYPDIPPNIDKPVVENEEFSIFYSATLNNKQLLYGAQIDGLLATNSSVAQPPQNANIDINLDYLRRNSFLELKTNRLIQNHKQERNFKRYKLLRCWCQCYLADLKGLLVGYRTDDGIIQYLQWFDTPEIVSYCKDAWNPQRAVDYLDYILTYIQNIFQEQKHLNLTTLQFELCSDGRILISNLESDKILPNWYTERIKNNTYFGSLL